MTMSRKKSLKRRSKRASKAVSGKKQRQGAGRFFLWGQPQTKKKTKTIKTNRGDFVEKHGSVLPSIRYDYATENIIPNTKIRS